MIFVLTHAIVCVHWNVTERGAYEVTNTSGMSAEQVLAAVEALEAKAPEINARFGNGGIGGAKFKLADIV